MPPAAVPAATSWMPGSVSEWVIGAVVACFIWLVKAQNDRILPAIAECTQAIRAMPQAMKEAVREGIREAEHERGTRV